MGPVGGGNLGGPLGVAQQLLESYPWLILRYVYECYMASNRRGERVKRAKECIAVASDRWGVNSYRTQAC